MNTGETVNLGADRPPGGEADDLLTPLKQEIQDLRDKNLRLLADVRNTQQRLSREKEESLRYAEADFARELLNVVDDLERAQEAERGGADARALAEGVRIATEHLMKVFRSRRIEPIEAAGKPFDPNLHEALMQEPSDDTPAGAVIREVARGYRMHERVLRPSRVVVSSGPGKGGQ